MKLVALGTEDQLSEAVGKRLLRNAGLIAEPSPLLRRGGFGYLRSKMKNWCQLAAQQHVVLITDLDTSSCPSQLLSEWSGGLSPPRNLVIRVAVREIESWLMADHVALRGLLTKAGVLPGDPDPLPQPKEHLLKLVERYGSKTLKNELLKETGALARQGLGYNTVLSQFIVDDWNPTRAATRSDRLHRAINRLKSVVHETHT